MKQLNYYRCMIYPLTKGISKDIGDNSNVGLKELHLFLKGDTYKDQLSAINQLGTKTLNTLTTLELREISPHHLDMDNEVGKMVYGNETVEACKRMTNLNKLCVHKDAGFDYYEPHFLANMLQDLHHIKEIEITPLSIHKAIYTNWTVNKEDSSNQQL